MSFALKHALIVLVLFCGFSFYITSQFFASKERIKNDITSLSSINVEYVRSECSNIKPMPITQHKFNRTRSIEWNVSQNTKVFIMSLPRSGSSFLVTRVLVKSQECTSTLPAQTSEVIQNMFSCDFRALKAKMDETKWDPKASWARAMYSSSSSDKVALCFPAPEDSLETIELRSHQNLAVKEIFFWAPKVNWLYPLLIKGRRRERRERREEEEEGEGEGEEEEGGGGRREGGEGGEGGGRGGERREKDFFDRLKYNSVAADLKVLWLVRDVRGWVSSFLQPEPNTHSDTIYEGWDFDTKDLWNEYKSCDLLHRLDPVKLSEYEVLLSNLSAPMHKRLAAMWAMNTLLTKIYLEESPGKYFLVQYEHLSMYTFGTVQQIYNFIGHPIPNAVLQWLAKATKQGDEKDRYSTFRQSDKMAAIWTKRLSLQQIVDIEAIVGEDLFQFFEYTPILDLLKKQ